MLEELVRFVAREDVLPFYMMLCIAVMVLPMLGLAIWVHRGIGRTEGGRRLMRDHGNAPMRSRSPVHSARQIGQAAAASKAVNAGYYGQTVKSTYKTVWVIVGLWLLANILVWGLPIYGQAINNQSEAEQNSAPATNDTRGGTAKF